MEDGKLIGLGQDADDAGTFAWFQGLKLSLFDVSDASNPTEPHNVIIGGRGSQSIALKNHLAFTFDVARGLLALPVSVHEGQSGTGNYWNPFSYAGLHLYYVTPEGGFELVDVIKDVTASDQSSQYGASSPIQRTAILGDDAMTGLLVMRRDNLELFEIGDALTSLQSVSWTIDAE
jgi:inhibitor of cysteine peptidase